MVYVKHKHVGKEFIIDHISAAGSIPVHSWSLSDDVHAEAVDDQTVRRILHRRGVQ